MARGDSAARHLQLMLRLGDCGELVVDDIAQDLRASRRTIYRDLLVLQRVGMPIYPVQAGKRVRWKVAEGHKNRLRITLSWSELLALWAGRGLLAGLRGTWLETSSRTAFEKIRTALPEPLVERVERAMPWLSVDSGARHDYASKGDVVEQLAAAIERQETVDFDYRKPNDRRFTTRRVDPYHLHLQQSAFYLVGWCHKRKGERLFRLDRATKVRFTGRRFARSADFSSRRFLHEGFGAWSGDAETIRLRFVPEAAPQMAEIKVHTSQVSQWRDDGSLDVTFNVPVSPRVVSWVVSWGPRVAVLGPKKLRNAVRREHQNALDNQPRENLEDA